jgi:hypothetical protein
VEVKVRENPFLRERISIGRPNIKPEKTTFMPVIKEIPQVKRPPEPIREIKVRELKEKRPLIKAKEVSVLRPESPPKAMTLRTKEGKPVEREMEKLRGPEPAERGVDRSKKSEKPGSASIKKVEPEEKGRLKKLKETKPLEKGPVEKPKEYTPLEKSSEKIKESKPLEKGMKKPETIEKGSERSKEIKAQEKGLEKSRKPIEKPKEVQKVREHKPEKEIEK